jgi:hypothetical protein
MRVSHEFLGWTHFLLHSRISASRCAQIVHILGGKAGKGKQNGRRNVEAASQSFLTLSSRLVEEVSTP